MADLSKIKVGDELRVTLRVSVLYSDMVRVGLGQDYATVGKTWIEAAEHIPALRYFKRGDWVKWNHGKTDCIHRHCLFIKVVLTEPALAVIDDNGQTFTVAVEQLSHDEAPE